MNNIISKLNKALMERKNTNPSESYVAQMHHLGLNKILEKLSEETTEVILAAKDEKTRSNSDEVIKEVADVWFHTIILLHHLDKSTDLVLEELEKRYGVSGLQEKASRKS